MLLKCTLSCCYFNLLSWLDTGISYQFSEVTYIGIKLHVKVRFIFLLLLFLFLFVHEIQIPGYSLIARERYTCLFLFWCQKSIFIKKLGLQILLLFAFSFPSVCKYKIFIRTMLMQETTVKGMGGARNNHWKLKNNNTFESFRFSVLSGYLWASEITWIVR